MWQTHHYAISLAAVNIGRMRATTFVQSLRCGVVVFLPIPCLFFSPVSKSGDLVK